MIAHRRLGGGLALRVGVLVALAASMGGPFVAAEGPTPPLVTFRQALQAGEPVQVVGMVDHSSVVEQQVGGSSGVVFALIGPSGGRMDVEVAGKLPPDFAVASTVVLEGTAREGRFHANRVLIPGAGSDGSPARGLQAVLGVTLVVWVGLFLYVLRLDRGLRRLEE